MTLSLFFHTSRASPACRTLCPSAVSPPSDSTHKAVLKQKFSHHPPCSVSRPSHFQARFRQCPSNSCARTSLHTIIASLFSSAAVESQHSHPADHTDRLTVIICFIIPKTTAAMSDEEYTDTGAVDELLCPQDYICSTDNDFKPTRCPYDHSPTKVQRATTSLAQAYSHPPSHSLHANDHFSALASFRPGYQQGYSLQEPVIMVCTPCSPGTASADGVECLECPQNQFADNSTMAECDIVAPGKYAAILADGSNGDFDFYISVSSGATYEIPCPAGYACPCTLSRVPSPLMPLLTAPIRSIFFKHVASFPSLPHSTISCSHRWVFDTTVENDTSLRLTECMPGMYQDEFGQEECKPCAPGMIALDYACECLLH